MDYKNLVIENIKKFYERGLFHIFGSQVINQIVNFAGGILLIRILSKDEFGIYTYAQNIFSIFLLINGFGVQEGLMQFGSRYESEDKKNKLIKYSFKIGLLSNIFLMVLMLFYTCFGTFKIVGAKEIFILMLFFPFLYTFFGIVQIVLRINLKNKEMSNLVNLNSILMVTGMLIGSYTFNLPGLVLGKYIGYIFCIFISYKYVSKIFKNWSVIKDIDTENKKRMIHFSLTTVVNNGLSQALYIADIFLIGVILSNENILATYKTATLIPFALSFIPSSIMIYMYPYFAKNGENKQWVFNKYLIMMKFLFCLNLLISISLVVFSKSIISFIFGNQYLDGVHPFIILSIGYFFLATFRIPSGNIINSIGKIKYNLYSTIISGGLNIVLDIIFITKFGSIGAAYATLIIFIVSGLIGNIFLIYDLRKN
ncbi:flippase [uncultured Fusobacterium sp.]|uniref:flippase n=1 Tax=uncultured Fusobacterium sp. TaxID=159267 RepID=UPI002598C7B7|nr:flippase [uncultured Fusobacterium sp.]